LGIAPAILSVSNRHRRSAQPVVYRSRLERLSGATCRSQSAAVWRLSRGVRVCLPLCRSGSTALSARYSTLFHGEYLSRHTELEPQPERILLLDLLDDCSQKSNEIAPSMKDARFVYLTTLTLSARLSHPVRAAFRKIQWYKF
jgi:hypothetical protein